MHKKKLIVGNWKMAPVKMSDAKKLFAKIKTVSTKLQKTEVVMCPPFIFLNELQKISSTKTALGAQNAFYEAEGAFTGEISLHMLVGMDTRYVILGHSERRALGETDALVAKKVAMALRVGIVPILCVGEKERDLEGKYLGILEEQIRCSLAGISKKIARSVIIAYEPLWAIGSKATAVVTPEELFEISIFIRKVISRLYDKNTAHSFTLLYGGSVDDKNSEDFLKVSGISGLLVGRASLNAEKFIKILKTAEAL